MRYVYKLEYSCVSPVNPLRELVFRCTRTQIDKVFNALLFASVESNILSVTLSQKVGKDWLRLNSFRVPLREKVAECILNNLSKSGVA